MIITSINNDNNINNKNINTSPGPGVRDPDSGTRIPGPGFRDPDSGPGFRDLVEYQYSIGVCIIVRVVPIAIIIEVLIILGSAKKNQFFDANPRCCYLLKTYKRIRVLYGLITGLVRANDGFSKTFFEKSKFWQETQGFLEILEKNQGFEKKHTKRQVLGSLGMTRMEDMLTT